MCAWSAVLIVSLALLAPSTSFGRGGISRGVRSNGFSGGSSSGNNSGGSVHVRSYTRRDGTQVGSYNRMHRGRPAARRLPASRLAPAAATAPRVWPAKPSVRRRLRLRLSCLTGASAEARAGRPPQTASRTRRPCRRPTRRIRRPTRIRRPPATSSSWAGIRCSVWPFPPDTSIQTRPRRDNTVASCPTPAT